MTLEHKDNINYKKRCIHCGHYATYESPCQCIGVLTSRTSQHLNYYELLQQNNTTLQSRSNQE